MIFGSKEAQKSRNNRLNIAFAFLMLQLGPVSSQSSFVPSHAAPTDRNTQLWSPSVGPPVYSPRLYLSEVTHSDPSGPGSGVFTNEIDTDEPNVKPFFYYHPQSSPHQLILTDAQVTALVPAQPTPPVLTMQQQLQQDQHQASAEATGGRRKRKRGQKKVGNAQKRQSGGCQGRCTNMIACMLQGGRPVMHPGQCPGMMNVCCSSWIFKTQSSSNKGANRRPKRLQQPVQHPPQRQKAGRTALALPPATPSSPLPSSISYSASLSSSAAPHFRAQLPALEPVRPLLIHNSFTDYENFKCGVSKNAQEKIMGGLDAGYGQFPWTAHIKIRGPGIDKECGGTLINRRWVITAGHCTQYCLNVPTCSAEVPQHEITYKVILGEYDQLSMEAYPPDSYLAVDVIRHPLYRNIMRLRDNGVLESEPRYDVALLLLDRQIRPAPNVAPLCLPPPELAETPPGTLATVVGWGRTGRHNEAPHSSILQAATIPVLSDRDCLLQTGLLNFDDQLCAGGVDAEASACPGDSGGALQAQDDEGRWVLLGIVSNGPSLCGLQPVVFHKVASTLQWVRNVIEREKAVDVIVVP